MNDRVWIVTSGSEIELVFGDEAAADRYAALLGDAWVESFVVFARTPEPTEILHISQHVTADGPYGREREWIENLFPGLRTGHAPQPPVRWTAWATEPQPRSHSSAIYLVVSGSDHERVRKVFSERVAVLTDEFDATLAAMRLSSRTWFGDDGSRWPRRCADSD